jgi:hypothetical protein
MFGRHLNLARFSALAIAAGAVLSGCASGGGAPTLDESTFFSDPAAYAMYDCKQLAGIRTAMNQRVEELRGLMTKAETGAGGSVVAEIAYRPDYVSAQAKLKNANQAWERNRCDTVTNPELARPQPGVAPPAARSSSRVY